MKKIPILFKGPLVRSILAGHKTKTRRLACDGRGELVSFDGQVAMFQDSIPDDPAAKLVRNRYGAAGDTLWVRENFALVPSCVADDEARAIYQADGEPAVATKWKPSIHMPRWASRISLEVTDVRVERLQDITEEDALAEGFEPSYFQEGWSCMDTEGRAFDVFVEPDEERRKDLVAVVHQPRKVLSSARERFRQAWQEINGKRASWGSNPWCWVVSFRRVRP